MTEQERFNAAVKSVAAVIAALLPLLSRALGWSPEIVTVHFIDLIASAVCSIAAIFYGAKSRVA